MRLVSIAAVALALSILPVAAEDFARWKQLTNPFPSTGGGGVMIHDYKPVVKGATCTTDFSVAVPDAPRAYAEATFDARSIDGGILCDNGRWRMKDGSGEGTTPFRVFIKDGVSRGDPLPD